MLGYLDAETTTAQAFSGGWFHSGDLGFYDEHGLLHVVDRKKDMIKTGGRERRQPRGRGSSLPA